MDIAFFSNRIKQKQRVLALRADTALSMRNSQTVVLVKGRPASPQKPRDLEIIYVNSRPSSSSPKQTVERVAKMISALASSVQQTLVHLELSDLLQPLGTPHLLLAQVIQESS